MIYARSRPSLVQLVEDHESKMPNWAPLLFLGLPALLDLVISGVVFFKWREVSESQAP